MEGEFPTVPVNILKQGNQFRGINSGESIQGNQFRGINSGESIQGNQFRGIKSGESNQEDQFRDRKVSFSGSGTHDIYSPGRKYLHLHYNHGRHGKHGRIVPYFLYSVFSVLSVVKLSLEAGEGFWALDYRLTYQITISIEIVKKPWHF
ncbi:MAG: hypothetical protein AB3K77_13670 [Methanosarcinaceae archaeon]